MRDGRNSTDGLVWWQEEGQGSGFGGLLRSGRSLDVVTPPFTVSLRGAPTDRNVVKQTPSRGGSFLSLRFPDRLNSPFSLLLPP
ncbi:MAG: hypothetical protein MJY67_07415, partial [Bacteroidales bacterium]|nr:hypothetical protein [Bacteroidales bacterium]